MESNHRPTTYEAVALTYWATRTWTWFNLTYQQGVRIYSLTSPLYKGRIRDGLTMTAKEIALPLRLPLPAASMVLAASLNLNFDYRVSCP